jgi:carbamoyltransferase
MTYVLGINAYHGDSAACLLRDGEIVAAVEEERFTRIKHWAGFPEASVAFCLQRAGISLRDVARVAVNQNSRAIVARICGRGCDIWRPRGRSPLW